MNKTYLHPDSGWTEYGISSGIYRVSKFSGSGDESNLSPNRECTTTWKNP
jgi:hypothetical protein